MKIEKFFKFLSSLSLAVIVIVSLAVLSAIGTIYEAKYDSEYAQKVIYHSVYMYTVLGTLCINLIFVMIDRWPWRKRHVAFVLAHVGIIVTLIGSYITKKMGVDGSMAFPIGESNRFVMVNEKEVNVYSAFVEGQPVRQFTKEVDFFLDSPKKNPIKFEVDHDQFAIDDYYHYAFRDEKFVNQEGNGAGPALRFQINSSRVNMTEWIYRQGAKPFEELAFGPATLVLSNGSYTYKEGNVMVLSSVPGKPDNLNYQVYSAKGNKLINKGIAKAGDVIATGWMDIQFRILTYMPSARRDISYRHVETPTPLTQSAMRVTFNGEEHWVGNNSMVKIYSSDKVYYVTYGNRRLDLGFPITLSDFRVGRYQGTMRAMTYESDVNVPDVGKVTISMNQPLKHSGFTFYQASFEEDEKGQPTISVLSVNKDPGRPLKYLGSFLIVLGSILLFYFKRLDFIKLGESE